jgi:sensor histidine kinase YesM
MLLQPFVENAINHGILYKNGLGHLALTFLKNGDELQCIIEDDGVGRKEAAKIQAQSFKPHISRATQILEERVKLLKDVDYVNVDISIIDINEENDKASGTKVIVRIG